VSENSAIQINWKTKRDGMLINLRANTPEELDVLIDGITLRLATLLDLEQTTEGMATTNKAVEVVTQAFPGAQPVQPPAPPAHNYAPTPPSPATGIPQCTCGAGEMRFVPAGISKSTGKPYRAFYACPRPQGQACKNRQNA
jgi:hypothetical protein